MLSYPHLCDDDSYELHKADEIGNLVSTFVDWLAMLAAGVHLLPRPPPRLLQIGNAALSTTLWYMSPTRPLTAPP